MHQVWERCAIAKALTQLKAIEVKEVHIKVATFTHISQGLVVVYMIKFKDHSKAEDFLHNQLSNVSNKSTLKIFISY